MNPMILMQILQGVAGTAGAALRAVPSIKKSDLEKENKGELTRLKHLRETGALGLTPEEQQRIFSRQIDSAEGQLARDAAKAQQVMASGVNMGAGQQMLQAQNQAAQGARIKTDIQQGIEDMSAKKAAAQEQEYWGRLASDSQAKKERLAAIMSIPATGLEAFSGASSVNATVAPDTSNEQLQSLGTQYGLSTEDLSALQDIDPAVLSKLLGA